MSLARLGVGMLEEARQRWVVVVMAEGFWGGSGLEGDLGLYLGCTVVNVV